MNRSALLWSAFEYAHAAGLRRAVAGAANRLASGRHFSIDPDGDWINRQSGATFVSTTPHGQHLSLIRERVVDEWLFDYRPSASDIVFDIGAGIGEEAVVLSPMVGRIFAIEAHPATFRCLTKTVALSGVSNVVPLHWAVTDRDGAVEISDTDAHIANRLGSGIPISGRSVESLCREHGIDRIDFLRMNIEGAERLAIQGLGAIDIGAMAISCHDFIGGDDYATKAEVRAWLDAHGYDIRERPDHPQRWTANNLYARKRAKA